jgi:hypothetical protein
LRKYGIEVLIRLCVVEPQANRPEQALFHRRGVAAWTRFIAGRYYATSMAGLGGQQRLGNSGINTVLDGRMLPFATPDRSGVGGVCSGVAVRSWRQGGTAMSRRLTVRQ